MPEEGQDASILTGSPPSEDSGEELSDDLSPMFVPESDETSVPPPDGSTELEDSPAEEPFDLASVDFRRIKVDDVPEEHRGIVEQIQKQFKAVEGDRSRELADLQQRESTVQAQLKELQELRDTLMQKQEKEEPPADATAAQRKVADILNDPQTDAETRSAIKLVEQIADEKIASVQEQYQQLMDQVAPILEAYPQLQQTLGVLSKREQDAHFDSVRMQVEEAKGEYGDDVDQFTEHILLTLGLDNKLMPVRQPLTNPKTGNPYTVKEAYELHSGKLAEKAAEMRAEDLRVRTEKKNRAASTPSARGGDTGSLTEKEARSKIRELGFGG